MASSGSREDDVLSKFGQVDSLINNAVESKVENGLEELTRLETFHLKSG